MWFWNNFEIMDQVWTPRSELQTEPSGILYEDWF